MSVRKIGLDKQLYNEPRSYLLSTYRTVIALVGATLMVGVSTTSFAAKGKAQVIRVSSPADEAEQNYSVYPPPGQCQFVDDLIRTQH
jgi:hypothetical protein